MAALEDRQSNPSRERSSSYVDRGSEGYAEVDRFYKRRQSGAEVQSAPSTTSNFTYPHFEESDADDSDNSTTQSNWLLVIATLGELIPLVQKLATRMQQLEEKIAVIRSDSQNFSSSPDIPFLSLSDEKSPDPAGDSLRER